MKKILFVIALFIVTLTVVHIDRKYIYPVHYDLPKLMHEYYKYPSKIHTVLHRLLENKTSNKKLIFWETPVCFGMKKSELIKLHPSTSNIKYGNTTIDVNIIYDCTYEQWDAKLKTINLRIPYNQSIENDLMTYYGEKYIRSRKGDNYFSVWALDEGFAVLEKNQNANGETYLYLELSAYEWDSERKVAYGAYNDIFDDKDKYLVDVTPKKDSIDILIEKRKAENFKSSIFAGLHFGDTPETVEQALKNENKKRVRVPINDKVETVYIASYDVEYYKNQLASLTLYAEEEQFIFGLETLYATKYGKTKERKWDFQNCSIAIYSCGRMIHDPMKEAGYASGGGPTLYYASYRGGKSHYITQDCCFLKIEYKDHHRLKLIERQKQITDSLQYVKKMRADEAERELAKKLATETATSI